MWCLIRIINSAALGQPRCEKEKAMDKYGNLNEMQQRAVYQTEGPVLILAGAGSGKTRVLTHRISYLVEELMVPAYHILAITFTNKAAKEMQERATALVGADTIRGAWISTFHSACIRILKQHAERLGYEKGFTIYDPEDQKAVIRRIMKELNLSDKMFTPKSILAAISNAKDELKGPIKYREEVAKGDLFKEKVALVYEQYQKTLRENQAMDFDDIICETVRLFQTQADVLAYYQEKFRYIMVDEYQDTNTAQYYLIRLLAERYENLCVVGDDDQSIYRFRGANIRNILDFEKDFPNALVIRLEQNYRSTEKILTAANSVIAHNEGRKQKTLWTENGQGENITLQETWNENEEAQYIAEQILQMVNQKGRQYKDIALLYRTNAQSRALEERLVMGSIPYRLYGGTPFYQRKEIKDMLCYLRVVANDHDYVAADRIINVPGRGIGAVTAERFRQFAEEGGWGVSEAAEMAPEVPDLKRSAKKLVAFGDLLHQWRSQLEQDKTQSIGSLIQRILEEVGYGAYLMKEDAARYEDRMQNIDELISRSVQYEEGAEEPSLSGFLDELALVAAIDTYEEGADVVSLMTLHSAKGLEFPVVFMTGLEDGVFPGYMSIVSEDPEDMEEERRLCYVGITRAREKLFITYAKTRRVHGQEQASKASRFLMEIPAEVLAEGKMRGRDAIDEQGRLERPARSFVKQHNQPFHNPYVKKTSTLQPPENQNETFQPGDTVHHKKFGLGTILEVKWVSADYQVRVNFAKAGEKLLFVKLAGLKKV
jgi:DNA helicase-2/ATP-dependent DNA helicase PcrA